MKKSLSHGTLAVCLSLLIALTSGCKSGKGSEEKLPNQPDQLVVVLFDSTASQTKEMRRACANYALSIIEDMKGDSKVMIVPFSNEKNVSDLSAIYNDMADDPTLLSPAFDELVENPSSNKGTFITSPLKLMAVEAGKTKLPVIGLIVTDGVFDDREKASAAVRDLAKQSNLKLVCVVPVKYQWRSKVERLLSPLGDKRWLVRTALDVDGGLEEIHNRLKK